MRITFTGAGDGRSIPAVGFRCKLCISLFCFFSLFISLDSLSAFGKNTQKPKLVVLIAIDAFRYDYLTRFEDHFSTGGFKFLLSQGANFTNTHINHLRPSTGPGHTTMLTGASGHFSGIVDNEWWDRNLQKKVNCVEDPTAQILGDSKGTNEKTTGRSPKNLNVTTVGDELRLSNNFKSKVIGISYKDRAAILPSGKLANAAYWFKKNTGDFISSSFYMSELPGWVREFNNQKIPDQYFGRNWDKLLDDDVYGLSRADNFPHERNYQGIGIIFPHQIDGKTNEPNKNYYEAFSHSPWADEHLTAFAKAVIENENLGQDDFTDILTISFSATDRIGHLFGPYSVEMQDQVLRIDRVLEKFFIFLDEKIGLDKIAIVLTADHGSGPVPEYMAQFDVEAGRIDTQQRPKGEDSVVIPTTVDSVLDSEFGQADWVEAFVKPNVYLNYAAIRNHNLNLSDVENKAAEALRKIKGIAEVFTRTQLSTGNLPANEISQRYLNQFYPERSGDLLVHLKPYFVTAGYKNSIDKGADHETGYDYDTHIPLIIFGKQVKSGTYSMSVNLNDLAPTLATILGVSFPSGNEGRVLFEALNPD